MFDIEKWPPFLMAKAHQYFHNQMRMVLEPYNLTPPQFATLAFLWRRDGLNQQELGTLMNVDRTTIGGVIERLERLELIQRGQDPRDRRSWVIFVTRKGKALQEKIIPDLAQVRYELDDKLVPEEQQILMTLLNKIRLL